MFREQNNFSSELQDLVTGEDSNLLDIFDEKMPDYVTENEQVNIDGVGLSKHENLNNGRVQCI